MHHPAVPNRVPVRRRTNQRRDLWLLAILALFLLAAVGLFTTVG
jgi:hypothetical protein